MSNPILPENVYRTLVEVCDRHPGPVQDDHLFGDILNEVAWRHRHEGFGLSRKTGGRRVPSPVGEIAEDVLMRSDGHHWDVLGAAAVGNPLRPGRGPSIGIMRDPGRPFVNPVEPRASAPPAQPPSPPAQPPPSPQPPQAPAVDLSSVTADLAAIMSRLEVIESKVSSRASSEEFHGVMGNEVVPHIDDLKRIVLGLPRDERFLK